MGHCEGETFGSAGVERPRGARVPPGCVGGGGGGGGASGVGKAVGKGEHERWLHRRPRRQEGEGSGEMAGERLARGLQHGSPNQLVAGHRPATFTPCTSMVILITAHPPPPKLEHQRPRPCDVPSPHVVLFSGISAILTQVFLKVFLFKIKQILRFTLLHSKGVFRSGTKLKTKLEGTG